MQTSEKKLWHGEYTTPIGTRDYLGQVAATSERNARREFLRILRKSRVRGLRVRCGGSALSPIRN